jgi:phospholipase C
MPFELRHIFTSSHLTPKLRKTGEEAFYEVELSGEFSVLFPGKLIRGAKATFVHRQRNTVPSEEGPNPGTAPRQAGWESQERPIPLTLNIFTPDGREFTADEITVADLRRFRNARGAPSGLWSFRLTGRGETIIVDEDSLIVNPGGVMRIGVIETIASASAPPLVDNVTLTPTPRTLEFDLFRVGTFEARISQNVLLGQWRGTLRLIDPDGAVRAQTTGTLLSFKVDLPELGKSRDATGKVRNWKLEVTPQTTSFGSLVRLHATVIGSGRITIAALQSRIDTLLGRRGEFIRIFGEDKNGQAAARLEITNVVAAETLDMHGLLDGFLGTNDVSANVIYTLGSKSETQKFGTRLRVGSLKIDAIDVTFGPGVKLGASVPALHLSITVSGKALIKFGALTVADIEVPGGKIDIEIGIRLSTDGTPEIVTAVPDTLFDGDVDTTVAATVAASTLGLVGAVVVEHEIDSIVQNEFNDPLVNSIRGAFSDPTLAPSILMTIFGAHLSYRPFRIEGEEIVFDHIAPVEPEPQPRQRYLGAIGRSFIEGPDAVRFTPPLLGDTWKADNLAKVDHIVVVMMENRSHDHVLGYRAAAGDGSDGLTAEMIAAIEGTGKLPGTTRFKVRNLENALFAENALTLRTRLPASVGHEIHDVQQQLSGRVPGPNGRSINDPKGFVDNFKPRLKQPPGETPHNVDPQDVLGFYDESQLKFFAFLAEHYAYCDRYYCSHPGPTLPNRMYSLTGELQYDRYGFPIVDNNNGDNFLLSRATTIYDLLARKGLTFRIYESAPSVTMLRMFARYATDTVNIVPFARLKADALAGNLPALTVIEPALHHHPQNDDHPDADMHRGQLFLQDVYDALRTGSRWEKTLLIITYDEHGGFYDHAVPPIAELLPTTDGMANHPGFATARTVSGTTAQSQGLLPVPYGVRVPTFVVSPWTMRGKGPGITLDHCSILKTVLARFLGAEKPFLSDRVSASHSFNAFLTEPAPRTVPAPPKLDHLPIGERIGNGSASAIVTPSLSRRRMRAGPVDFHDISGRWARQLGR